jgi:hypothetical protein
MTSMVKPTLAHKHIDSDKTLESRTGTKEKIKNIMGDFMRGYVQASICVAVLDQC